MCAGTDLLEHLCMSFAKIITKIRGTLRYLDYSTLRQGRNLGQVSSLFIYTKNPGNFILDDVCENQKRRNFVKFATFSLFNHF
jgi:hypothetical protein